MTAYRGEDMIGDNGYGTTEHALKSAHDALWAIANMQITENTDKGEVLALCMSIARIELEKCSTAGLQTQRTEGGEMSREKLELVVEILRSRAKFLEAAYYLETAKSLIHAAELVQQCMDEVTTLSEEKKERIRNAISVGNLYPEWLVTRIEEIITEPPKDIVLEVQNGKLGHRSTLD